MKQLKANWNNQTAKCKTDRNCTVEKRNKNAFFQENPVSNLRQNSVFTLSHNSVIVSWPLMSSLMSTEPAKINLLYACAVAMGVNDLIGCLTMHHLDYKCDLLENRLKVTARPFCFLSILL